ncbi:MAG: ribosome biogenesis GTPase Der [Acidobacteria bacterium]|nr:ribosome biogenesis GTPase Der [Acidobacteriota bacterium]
MLKVTIVGRPNVGKSTLFNRLCGARISIVGDEPGITRDRISGSVSWNGRWIELADTGGLLPDVRDVIPAKVREQVVRAIASSDLVLLVVDGRAGVTALDEQLLPVLRRTGKPFWVTVNKIDTAELEPLASSFYAFGAERLFSLSAEHGRGLGDLLDAMAELGSPETVGPSAETSGAEVTVAVVGRPNVGKSSLVNRLLGEERAIVTEIPGTTVDSIDSLVTREGVRYRFIDTAGIRRKGRTEARTEKISVLIARRSMKRAAVALLLVDAVEGVTKADAAIGGYAAESGCSVIIVLNKWDVVAKDSHTVERFTETVRRRMKYLSYAPVVTISALTGLRVARLFDLIDRAFRERRIRVPTGELNNLFVAGMAAEWRRAHPSQKLDIRYMTQTGIDPPTFVVFVKGGKPLHFSSERFLINQLREKYGFFASPIRILQRFRRAGD